MPSRPIRRLWGYGRNHRRRVWLASTFSIANKLMDIAPEILIGAAVDVAVRRQDSWLAGFGIETVEAQFVTLGIVTFIVWALESTFEYAHNLVWRNLAQSVQHDLRIDAYAHLQDLDMAYFEEGSTGDLMAVLNDDVNQLERFLNVGANDILQIVTAVLGVGTVFVILSPTIALLAVLPVPFIVIGSLRFTKAMGPRYAEVRRQAGTVNSQLANNLGGIATIKSFAAEDREIERISRESNAYREVNRRAIRLSSAFVPVIRIGILAGFLVTLLYGGFRVIDGTMEVGAYSVLVFLTQRLLWPLTRLGETLDLYHRAMASTNRILDVLDTEATIVGGDEPLPNAAGEVEFAGVSYTYPKGVKVLDSISISAQAGDTVAIVGATGSGKTTMVKLLLRFMDPDSGTICIDGHDLRALDLTDLRNAVALVSQDVFLFPGTVSENIAYGRPGATDDQIRDAAIAAEAHEFITQLPDGYGTMIGERGQRLSGGQRQRLSIARALISGSPILVLDEATSSVDNETEAAIQRSLSHIAHNKTTLVIAHRLSTVRQADRIYVLEGGRVVDSGTHDQLIEGHGIYANLWRVQTGEAVRQ